MNDYQKECTYIIIRGIEIASEKGFQIPASTRTLQGDNLVIQPSQQLPHFIYLTMCKDGQILLNHY